MMPQITAPGGFAQLATAYSAKYGVPAEDIKRAMAHISSKSHTNGALNPKAHLRKPISEDQVMAAAALTLDDNLIHASVSLEA